MRNTMDARRLYRETSVRGATPVELVVILYDTALEDMRSALAAMQRGDIEGRTHHISHALIVLQQLQGTLDFERGGAAARQFEQFYSLVRAKLLEVQIRCSPELMQEQMRYFSEVRDCWLEANRALLKPKSPGAANEDLNVQAGKNEWNA